MVQSKLWYMAWFSWIAGYWYYASWSRTKLMGFSKHIIVLVFMLPDNIFDSLSGYTPGFKLTHVNASPCCHHGNTCLARSKVCNREQIVWEQVSKTSGKQQVEDKWTVLYLVIEWVSIYFRQNLHWRPLFWIFIDAVLHFEQTQKNETLLESTNKYKSPVLPWKQFEVSVIKCCKY